MMVETRTSEPFAMRILKQTGILFLFTVLIAHSLYGQGPIHFVTGREPGPNPQENEWFYDTLRHRLDRWSENGWTPMDKRVDSAGACHVWVWSVSDGNLRIWDRHGVMVNDFPQHLECLDSMIVLEIQDYSHAIPQSSNLKLYDMSGKERQAIALEVGRQEWRSIPLDGRKGLLLAEIDFLPKRGILPFLEYRNWGVYGGNFRWLIPPIYDEPIRFVNGVAEVTTYGKRQRINEKGQVLE